MKIYEFGDLKANIVLIQMVDEHDLACIENEVALIKKSSDKPFCLIALKVEKWNTDLSPWASPAIFGNDDFGDGAKETLAEILKICSDENKKYYIGGYSLAGLFALWAAYQTDRFLGVAAASPSMWFPSFIDYMKVSEIKTNKVYLSLGDKENKTRNHVMATVADKIREAYELLSKSGVKCVLEWNEGNHFKDFEVRTAKAFSWIINQ